jgi:hypothetical protein
VIIDYIESNTVVTILEQAQCQQQEYEQSHIFLNNLTTKLPWTELIVVDNGKVHQVWCLVCTKIEGWDKFFAPKLDLLWKHGGIQKAIKDILRFANKGEFYTTQDCQYLKNEVLFLDMERDTIAKQIVVREMLKWNKKNLFNFLAFTSCREMGLSYPITRIWRTLSNFSMCPIFSTNIGSWTLNGA